MKAAWLRIWNTKNDMMVSSLGFLFASPIPDQHPNRSMGTEQKGCCLCQRSRKEAAWKAENFEMITALLQPNLWLHLYKHWLNGEASSHQPDKVSQPLAEEASVKAKLPLSGNEILYHNVTGDPVKGLVF